VRDACLDQNRDRRAFLAAVMRRERVVVYVTRGTELLVFEHRDDPDADAQVPAGGVQTGEPIEHAAIREVVEVTGLVLDGRPSFLGAHDHLDGLGRPARSSFFQIEAPGSTADEWQHTVTGDGEDRGLVFVCRFDRDPRLHETQSRFWAGSRP